MSVLILGYEISINFLTCLNEIKAKASQIFFLVPVMRFSEIH